MEKLYNLNGDVAVLVSPGYGAGWFSWNREYPECLFDKELALLVQEKIKLEEQEDETGVSTIDERAHVIQQIIKLAGEKFDNFYPGGADQLTIEWLPEGTPFEIHEYDGSESIELADRQWQLA
jgi:hypothetical protein